MATKINIKATSIVEAMIVMLVIVSGVTGMYNIYNKSIELSTSTTNKIKAIQIATQGIEAMTNIRDTNWLLFSSDYNNCWNTLDYNSSCIGDNSSNNKIAIGSYKIYKNSDNRWYTSSGTTNDYSNNTYRDFFKVGLNNGIFTQTGTTNNLKPIFTRELLIDYLKANGTTPGNETDPKMKIISKVQWTDNTSTVPHKIEIEQILSNWKK